MRVLVTGATGFIGSTLVERLVAQGQTEVVALVHPEYRQEPLTPGLRKILDRMALVIADLRDFQATAVALEKARPDLVFHLAAAGVRDPFLPIEQALASGLVPIVHGDVAFDEVLGGTIISTEEILTFLAYSLKPRWLLLAGETRGVLGQYRLERGTLWNWRKDGY